MKSHGYQDSEIEEQDLAKINNELAKLEQEGQKKEEQHCTISNLLDDVIIDEPSSHPDFLIDR